MRKIFIIFFLVLSLSVYPATYYVATIGNDGAAGTIGAPWATWQKAFDVAMPGDTVYFRGGVWKPTTHAHGNNCTMIKPTSTSFIGHSGTAENPICYFNYPGEVPVLDGSLLERSGAYNTGISITDASYLNFRGLTVRNFYQNVTDDHADGIMCMNVTNFRFENMTVHHIGGVGLGYFGYWDADPEVQALAIDSTYFINCDVYNCCDSILSDYPGGRADGYFIQALPASYVYMYGCRAWNNSDDGINLDAAALMIVKNCWSFANGWMAEGDGNGFKLGAYGTGQDPTRILTNCLSAFNHNHVFQTGGYDHNNGMEGGFWPRSRIYNCVSYSNDFGFVAMSWATPLGVKDDIYHNNISYKDTKVLDFGLYEPTSDTYNNWHHVNSGSPYYVIDIPITDADFVSVDSAGITAARKADNSLPDINFLKLSPRSKLIDVGTDVGLSYYGSKPDLGYSEYKQIIADHSIVVDYDKIPQYYIDQVKKMWLVVPGESHTAAYRSGLTALMASYPTYAVNALESGTPEAYTTAHLRTSRATWGDYGNATGWIHWYGEEDWFTNATALSRTKAGITYCNSNSLTISAIGFGWCGDMLAPPSTTGTDPVTGNHWWGWSVDGPDGDKAWGVDADDYTVTGNSVSMDTYLDATQQYIDYCTANGYSTTVFFTTGPVESASSYSGEIGYQGHLKQEHIRDYVKADPTRILFDYADILCYDDNGTPTTTTWSGHTYNKITTTNEGSSETGHIGAAGALRLAKAMWWMLARIAGWDGVAGEVIPATSVTVTSEGNAITITTDNGTLQLYADVQPNNATNRTVTWSIVDGSGHATIGTYGLVTAVADGTVTATATTSDGTDLTDDFVITISNQGAAQTGTDIITFTLSEQTGSATINPITHTVSIEVEYGTDVSSLTPTITVSSGATIDPLSGVSRDFTSPKVYTVTAEDLTEQNWTVTVIVAETPPTGVRLLKNNGKLLKSGGKLLIIEQ